MTRRVVVTGIGAITPIGSERKGLWEGVLRGTSAVTRVTRFDPSAFRSQIAAEVNDFSPGFGIDAKQARRLDRFSLFSLVASHQAVDDANLDVTPDLREKIGVSIGTALGGISFGEVQHERFLNGGLRAIDPTLALAVFGGASATNVAIAFGLMGPTMANANSCASGAVAIGEAYRAIRAGRSTVILAGGAEAPLAPLTFGSFSVIKAMSTRNDDPGRACRPFDANRDGFVMAEGAAVLVLEEAEFAVGRGARILAEIIGYGSTNDAYHMTAPRPDGSQSARAIQLALDDANLPPSAVDYVNAHGSSTPLNDATETRALKLALGNHAYSVPISSTKAMHGHALGASGAIEAAIVTMSLAEGYVPPTINLTEADPTCDLDYVPNTGRQKGIEVGLSDSFGFGGINAALLSRRWL
ncbi:MAG TPA: beta-ketoacyl-ACP synthase II [Chloroflexota bacterium]|nr:beta-ketoacyl-ACP synthase II [Chloroflexota bacterium]